MRICSDYFHVKTRLLEKTLFRRLHWTHKNSSFGLTRVLLVQKMIVQGAEEFSVNAQG